MTRIILTLSLAFLLTGLKPICAYGQAEAGQRKQTSSPVRLLPGYKIKAISGFEGGLAGTIWKEDGPRIEFDVRSRTASAIDSVAKEQILWREEQSIGENQFVLVYTRSDELVIAVFGNITADFHAKIRNPRDLAEVLLIVLTFEPFHGYPVDPSVVVH